MSSTVQYVSTFEAQDLALDFDGPRPTITIVVLDRQLLQEVQARRSRAEVAHVGSECCEELDHSGHQQKHDEQKTDETHHQSCRSLLSIFTPSHCVEF